MNDVNNLRMEACQWVEKETDIKCQTKQETCEGIKTPISCETLGIAESKTCFWVKGNSSKSSSVDSICKEKVC
jgi:hypothetical protein